MTLELSRRGFVGGLIGIIAAPAIVKYANLMPVKAIIIPESEEMYAYVIHGEDYHGNIMRETISVPPKWAMSEMRNFVSTGLFKRIDRIDCSVGGYKIGM